MNNDCSKPHPVDARIILYRMTKQVAAIVAIVFALKLLLLDIIPVRGNQMAPAIQNSDRVLMLRLPYLPVIRHAGLYLRGDPVIFSIPFVNKLGCLRIAGIGGDSVSVDDGIFRNSKAAVKRIPAADTAERTEIMPAEYSPRDYIDPYRVPAPGDTIILDSLDPYQFCFAASVFRQENPSAHCVITPHVIIDDTVSSNFRIADFILYKGPLDSIPDTCRYDWFFWKRLTEYLQVTMKDRKVSLTYDFYINGKKNVRYIVKNRFLFLLADNWRKGYDSRYFGPVLAASLVGRPLLIVWSYGVNEGGDGGLHLKRLGRLLP